MPRYNVCQYQRSGRVPCHQMKNKTETAYKFLQINRPATGRRLTTDLQMLRLQMLSEADFPGKSMQDII